MLGHLLPGTFGPAFPTLVIESQQTEVVSYQAEILSVVHQHTQKHQHPEGMEIIFGAELWIDPIRHVWKNQIAGLLHFFDRRFRNRKRFGGHEYSLVAGSVSIPRIHSRRTFEDTKPTRIFDPLQLDPILRTRPRIDTTRIDQMPLHSPRAFGVGGETFHLQFANPVPGEQELLDRMREERGDRITGWLDHRDPMAEVERIVADLEGGNLGLTESLQQYETGIKISDEELSQVKLKRSEF